MSKETAAQRRAREATEARAAQETWAREKCVRLLKVLARAQELGLKTSLQIKQDDVFVHICDKHALTSHQVYLSELSVWEMQSMEQGLADLQAERARESRLREVRAQLIATLTEEQKEALGI